MLGTRPEAIKLAPVVSRLRAAGPIQPVLISTGQHPDLLPAMLGELGLAVDYEIGDRRPDESLNELAARVLRGMQGLLSSIEPCALVVQGDTTTSVVAAMAAFHCRVPVVHVEAGLRSGRRCTPYPEETNRRMISLLAGLHLAPTEEARANLIAEGVSPASVVVTGNTVVDAMNARLRQVATFDDARLAALPSSGRRIVLLTMHRRESWGPPMRAVADSIASLLMLRDDTTVVVPAHPNPIVRHAMEPLMCSPDAIVTDPLPYGAFLRLLSMADLVLTDSGGVQEEAPSFGVPVLVLRDETERRDGVRTGVAEVIGTDPAVVWRYTWDALERPRRAPCANPYGDGAAARRCVDAIFEYLRQGRPADVDPGGHSGGQIAPSRSSSVGATTRW